jgi:phage baseplate assembly protein W
MSALAPDTLALGFPFTVERAGRIDFSRGDDRIRDKVLQVLLTAPGERVNLPDFGCSLLDLVFEPQDSILASVVEFSVAQALSRWLGDEIVVERVDVEAVEETVTVEVAWVSRAERTSNAIRVRFR